VSLQSLYQAIGVKRWWLYAVELEFAHYDAVWRPLLSGGS